MIVGHIFYPMELECAIFRLEACNPAMHEIVAFGRQG